MPNRNPYPYPHPQTLGVISGVSGPKFTKFLRDVERHQRCQIVNPLSDPPIHCGTPAERMATVYDDLGRPCAKNNSCHGNALLRDRNITAAVKPRMLTPLPAVKDW